MKPRDIFGIAVRLLGLVFLGRGLLLVPEAADELLRGLVQLDPARIVAALWVAGWPLLAAFWLVRGAPPLLRMAYPEVKEPGESAPDDSEKKQ